MEAATARTAGARPSAPPGGALNRLRGDRKLVERFQAGDDAAFAVLYDRHRSRLMAIAIGVLGSTEDAQDAVQDAFMSAASALRTRTPDDVRAWLSRVARNAAIDVARGRRPTAEVADGDSLAAGPARQAEVRSELVELVAALKDLPERQRTALVMRELSGASYAEIGTTLGTDEAAVRGLIARGRLSLRAAREARALQCGAVRERLAVEVDGRRRTADVRRHLKGCSECRRFQAGLRDDAKALRGLVPVAGVAGLVAILASIKATRPLLVGGALLKGFGATQAVQLVAACVVCAGAAEGVREIAVRAPAPHRTRAAAAPDTAGNDAAPAVAAAEQPGSRSEVRAESGPRPMSGLGAAEQRVARGRREAAVTPAAPSPARGGWTGPDGRAPGVAFPGPGPAGGDQAAGGDTAGGGPDGWTPRRGRDRTRWRQAGAPTPGSAGDETAVTDAPESDPAAAPAPERPRYDRRPDRGRQSGSWPSAGPAPADSPAPEVDAGSEDPGAGTPADTPDAAAGGAGAHG